MIAPGRPPPGDSLGHAHHLGQHTQALTYCQHALTLNRDLGIRYQEADTLTHLGDTHYATDNPQAARDAWQQAHYPWEMTPARFVMPAHRVVDRCHGRPGRSASTVRRLASRVRVPGSERPSTLVIRVSLAYWSIESGHNMPNEEKTALLAVAQRVLGPEHPTTLVLRDQFTRTPATPATQAISHPSNALIPIVERIIGAEHPRTVLLGDAPPGG